MINIFDKVLVKKETPTKLPNLPKVLTVGESEYFRNSLESEIEKQAKKFLENRQTNSFAKSVSFRVKVLPPYMLMESLYNNFINFATPVDTVASTLSGYNLCVRDINGYDHEIIKKEVEKYDGSFSSWVYKAVKQFLVYGQCIDNKFGRDEKNFKFRLLASAFITDLTVDNLTKDVMSFYYADDIERIRLDNYTEKKFHHVKIEDLSDLYLGIPPLLAGATEMDKIRRDDELYQLFLRNNAYNTQILLLSPMVTPEEQANIENIFTTLRETDGRYKIPVIPNAFDTHGNQKVMFQPVNQRMENRLGTDEKNEIAKAIISKVGLSPATFGFTKATALANSELQTTAVLEKTRVYKPMTVLLEELFQWRLQERLKFLEKDGFFKKKRIIIKSTEGQRIATADDFEFKFEKQDNLLPETKIKLFLDIAKINTEREKSGLKPIFGFGEMKKRYLDLEDKDINEIDNVQNKELNEITAETSEEVERESLKQEIENKEKSKQAYLLQGKKLKAKIKDKEIKNLKKKLKAISEIEKEYNRIITELYDYLQGIYNDDLKAKMEGYEKEIREEIASIYNSEGSPEERAEEATDYLEEKQKEIEDYFESQIDEVNDNISELALSALALLLIPQPNQSVINEYKAIFKKGYLSNIKGNVAKFIRQIDEMVFENISLGADKKKSFKKSLATDQLDTLVHFNRNDFKLSVLTHPTALFRAITNKTAISEGYEHFKAVIANKLIDDLNPSGVSANQLYRIKTADEWDRTENLKNVNVVDGMSLHHNDQLQYLPIETDNLDKEKETAKEQRAELKKRLS